MPAALSPHVPAALTEIGSFGVGSPATYSADGRWLALATSRGLLVLEVRSLAIEAFVPMAAEHLFDVAFSPNGADLLLAHDDGVSLWSTGERSGRLSLQPQEPDLAIDGVVPEHALAFDETGRYLAVVTQSGVVVIDFPRRKALATVHTSERVDLAAFASNTLFMAHLATPGCQCDDAHPTSAFVAEWTLGSRQVRERSLDGNPTGVAAIWRSTMATAHGLWDLRSGRRTRAAPPKSGATALSVSLGRDAAHWAALVVAGGQEAREAVQWQDGATARSFALAAPGAARILWRPDHGEVLAIGQDAPQEPLQFQAFSRDGTHREARHEALQCIVGSAPAPLDVCKRAAPGQQLSMPPRKATHDAAPQEERLDIGPPGAPPPRTEREGRAPSGRVYRR